MNYTHITQEERYQIYALKKAGINQSKISEIIGRSPSTISRELKRNRGLRGYRPHQAHIKSLERRAINARRIDTATWDMVREKLLEEWSPEQISGQFAISHETVYGHIYANKRHGGLLWKKLRCQKQRKKRYGKLDRRGAIPDRHSIETRPHIVETRSRVGDWEADTIIGKHHKMAIVSLVERKTRFLLLVPLKTRRAEEVRKAFGRAIKKYPAGLKRTLTYDQGREMAEHLKFTRQTKMQVYFAHPASPWERGTNENTNGLVRQYFPKGTDFSKVTASEIRKAQDQINGRPRRCLDYATPAEVFQQQVLR